MNRQEKSQVINSVKADFQGSEASFVVSVKGLTVDDVQKLRKSLYAKKSALRVVKNSLLKIAISDLSNLKDLAHYFKEQVAIVFADHSASEIANILYEAAKINDKFKLLGGSLDSKVLNGKQVEHLAKLPSKEILLAQVCGTLQAPIRAYVNILNQLIVRLLWVLKKIEEKK